MIKNIGVDMESVSRFRQKRPSFLKKIMSARERREMGDYNPQRVAGIFCAKEAIIKACASKERIHFEHIEILHRKNGAPYAAIRSKKITSGNVKISISHTKDHAIAIAILLKV